MATPVDIIIRGTDQVSRMLQNIAAEGGRTGSALSRAMDNAKRGSYMVAAAIGVGLGAVVKFGSDFEKAMTESTAIMVGLSEEARDKMEGIARSIAKTTSVSATEAAEAYYFLASAGLDAAQSMAALPQVAMFAEAGQFDLNVATELLTDSVSALGMRSTDAAKNLEAMTKVSDVLVKANLLATGSTEQFAEALTSKAGAALKVLGKPLEEGVAVLAAFADRGVKGAEAGEMFNRIMRDIPRAIAKNKDEFDRFGISLVDTNGNLKHSADIIDALSSAMDGMSDEAAAMMFDQLGINRGALDGIKILNGSGAAIRDYEAKLRDAGGVTEHVAKEQIKNFRDQLDLLGNKLIDVGITAWDKFVEPLSAKVMPALQEGALRLGSFVENIEKVDPSVLASIGGALAGSLVPALWALTAAAWSTFGPLVPFAVIGAAVGVAIQHMVEAAGGWGAVAERFKTQTGKIAGVLEAAKGIYEGFIRGVKNGAGPMRDGAGQGRGLANAIDGVTSALRAVRPVVETFGRAIGAAFRIITTNGPEVIGVLTAVATRLALLKVAALVAPMITALGAAFAVLQTAIFAASAVAGGAATALEGLALVVGALGGPVTVAVVAVAALAGGLAYLAAKNREAKDDMGVFAGRVAALEGDLAPGGAAIDRFREFYNKLAIAADDSAAAQDRVNAARIASEQIANADADVSERMRLAKMALTQAEHAQTSALLSEEAAQARVDGLVAEGMTNTRTYREAVADLEHAHDGVARAADDRSEAASNLGATEAEASAQDKANIDGLRATEDAYRDIAATMAGLPEGLGGARAAMQEQLDELLIAYEGFGGTAEELGRNVGSGFAAGIAAGMSPVDAASRGLARVPPDRIAAELEMQSPSRVMHRAGANIPAGLANGIRGAISLVSGAIRAITGVLKVPSSIAGSWRSSGSGLISAFISGINSASVRLRATIKGIVQWIRDHLPGSDAKMGPLSDLTASGAAFPRTLAKGALVGLPALKRAVAQTVGAMAVDTSASMAMPSLMPAMAGAASSGGGGNVIHDYAGATFIVSVPDGKVETFEAQLGRKVKRGVTRGRLRQG